MGDKGKVEVGVRLKLDGADVAIAGVKKLGESFGQVYDHSEEARSSIGELMKQAAATALGLNFDAAIHGAIDFGKELFAAGVEAQGADQAVAGLITSVQGIPWKQAYGEAQEFGDRLDEIAVKAGQAGSDVAAAFNAIVEVTGATKEGLADAMRQTEQMTTVANVLGKSAEGMAREFAFMGEGVVKTKGQLFQLLQPTGIFGDNTKKAAEYWSKLTEESRTKALAYGLEQVSGRLGKATPTIGDLLTSLENLYGMAREQVGEPLAKALGPALEKMNALLHRAIPDIQKFAETMATQVGRWVDDAVKRIEEGFAYLKTHQQEIRDAIVEGYEKAKAVVEFILAHKEAIALAFGAKAVAPTAMLAGRAVQGVYAAGASAAGQGIFGAGAASQFSGGIGAAGMGVAAVGAFAAAVAAWAAAIDQWKHLMDITGGGKSEARQDQDARTQAFQNMAANPAAEMDARSIKQFEELRQTYVNAARELGDDARAAGEMADRAWNAHKALHDAVAPVIAAGHAVEQLAAASKTMPDSAEIQGKLDEQVQAIATGFSAAMQAHNEGAGQYIATMLGKSTTLQDAFLRSADLTAEGFEQLAKLVEGSSGSFAEKLREIAGMKSGATTPAAPKVVMTGGQTFKIEQNFRDQDPDRVALVFERDLMKLAERRLQAGTTIPFGG